jgi:YfiH family protein
MEIETFAGLEMVGLRHGFSTRSAGSVEQLNEELQESFRAAGFPVDIAVQAEQTHGNGVAVVDGPSSVRVPGVDALVTATVGLPLVVRVADCGPVFFYDPVRRVIALAHSGRKGTEANIVGATIVRMAEAFGSDPADLTVLLGPCIRPPYYEVDFAQEIGRQARSLGVRHFEDDGVCTAGDLKRYYSYRAEKGKTGRMWGMAMLE